MTVRTIWSRLIRFETLNLLLSNTLLVTRAHIAGRANFAVVHDVVCNTIVAFGENNSLYAWSPDPSFLVIRECGAQDYSSPACPL